MKNSIADTTKSPMVTGRTSLGSLADSRSTFSKVVNDGITEVGQVAYLLPARDWTSLDQRLRSFRA